MSRPTTVAIGSRTRSSAPADARSRILTLFGPDAGERADGVFALIEAGTPQVDHAYDALKSACEASGASGTAIAVEEEYVARVLTTVNLNGASVALAVWSGRDVVLGSYRGGHAYACTANGLLDVAAGGDEPESDSGLRVRRFTPSEEDAVVLTSESVAEQIQGEYREQTICDTVSAGFSMQDAAEWLCLLARRGGDRNAGALIVRFQALRSAAAPKDHTFALPGWPRASSRSIGVGIAGLALCAVAVFAAFHLYQQHSSSGHTAAKPSARVRTLGPAPPTVSRPVGVQPRSAPSPSPIARATPVGTIVLTHPLESWKFPALPNTPGTVLLALYNPQKDALMTDVRIIGRAGTDARRVRVPGRSTIKLPLPSSEVRDSQQGLAAIIVQDNAPIVPMRVVVKQGTTSSSA